MAKRQERRDRQPMEKAMELTDLAHRKTDPQGSYTGQPIDPWEKPLQSPMLRPRARAARTISPSGGTVLSLPATSFKGTGTILLLWTATM